MSEKYKQFLVRIEAGDINRDHTGRVDTYLYLTSHSPQSIAAAYRKASREYGLDIEEAVSQSDYTSSSILHSLITVIKSRDRSQVQRLVELVGFDSEEEAMQSTTFYVDAPIVIELYLTIAGLELEDFRASEIPSTYLGINALFGTQL